MQSWSWTSSWQSCQVSWPGAWPGGHHHTPVRRGLGSPGSWCQVSAATGAPGPVSRVSYWTEGDHRRHSDHGCSVGVAVPEPELASLSSLIILDSLVTFLLGPCPPSTLSLSLTPCFLPPSLSLCSLLSAADPGLLLIFYWLGDIAEDCTVEQNVLSWKSIIIFMHSANINLVDSLFSFLLWI